jgi:hypothetical protein
MVQVINAKLNLRERIFKNIDKLTNEHNQSR